MNAQTQKKLKDEIDNMDTNQLHREFIGGGFGELRPYAESVLAVRDKTDEDNRASRLEAREEESLSISRDALSNSREANKLARRAIIIAGIAAATAAISIYIQIFIKSP